MDRQIIDTHIHIWDFARASYPWLEGNTSLLNRNYLLNELNPQINRAGITAGVLVQAANNPEDTMQMLEAASENNWIAGVIGWLPLENPPLTNKRLQENYLIHPYFKGARHLIHDEPDPRWLLQKEVLESLHLLAKHHLTYDIIGVTSAHLETAIEVGRIVPDLKMVLDHMNHPPIASDEKFGRWGVLMKQASQNPNIYCKISGLGTCTRDPQRWSKEEVISYIIHAINLFGTDRCFCGGDWPVSLLAGSYENTWNIYKHVIKETFTLTVQEKIFFQNARLFYNLDIG